MINIAIFASGAGSNVEKLLDKLPTLSNINVSFILTDKKNAGVIKIAKSFNKRILVIQKETQLTTAEHEKEILTHLKKEKVGWILLAGYMRILSRDFIKSFFDSKLQQNKIINIHPSLLPKFRGLNAYEQAYHASDTNSGVTIHFVDSGIDTGKIIIQKSLPRYENDSLEDFKKRGLALEHIIYPEILEKLDTAVKTGNYKDFYEI